MIEFKQNPLAIGEIKKGSTVLVTFEFTGNPEDIVHISPQCYDRYTDVLTNKGWVNWSNIKGDELFYSINPKTLKTDYVKAIDYISYKSDTILDISNTSFSLGVTSGHTHVFFNKNLKNKLQLKTLDDAIKNKQNRFLNAVNNSWVGNNTSKIKVGNYTWEFTDYVKIMAWFLSEGSCFKKKNRNVYVFDIRQSEKKHLKEIQELILKCFNKKGSGTDRCSIYIDENTGKFFSKFGKSDKKYIPDNIKNASSENINLFLETYLKGDGHQRVKSNNSIEKVIYTSSPFLKDDISELIIKIGKRPSVSISKNKEKLHKNGLYTSKLTNYCIYILNTVTTSLGKTSIKEVEYNDNVYCVTLEKWNTLFVRRNGKYTISGNCGCTAQCTVVGNTIQAEYTDHDTKSIDPKVFATHYPSGVFTFIKAISVYLKDDKDLMVLNGLEKTFNPEKQKITLNFTGTVRLF